MNLAIRSLKHRLARSLLLYALTSGIAIVAADPPGVLKQVVNGTGVLSK